MRGLLSFLYGVAAYAAGLVALLYFIGFSGNLLVPKSVDVGAGAPWAAALGIDVLSESVVKRGLRGCDLRIEGLGQISEARRHEKIGVGEAGDAELQAALLLEMSVFGN